MIDTIFRLARNDLGVVARHGPAIWIVRDMDQIHSLGEGLIQADSVGDDGKMCHAIAMPDEMLHDGRLVALRQTVCSKLSSLDVRRVHGEDIAFIFTGGKSGPR